MGGSVSNLISPLGQRRGSLFGGCRSDWSLHLNLDDNHQALNVGLLQTRFKNKRDKQGAAQNTSSLQIPTGLEILMATKCQYQ